MQLHGDIDPLQLEVSYGHGSDRQHRMKTKVCGIDWNGWIVFKYKSSENSENFWSAKSAIKKIVKINQKRSNLKLLVGAVKLEAPPESGVTSRVSLTSGESMWRHTLIWLVARESDFGKMDGFGTSRFRGSKNFRNFRWFQFKNNPSIPVDSAYFCFHLMFTVRPVPIATRSNSFKSGEFLWSDDFWPSPPLVVVWKIL